MDPGTSDPEMGAQHSRCTRPSRDTKHATRYHVVFPVFSDLIPIPLPIFQYTQDNTAQHRTARRTQTTLSRSPTARSYLDLPSLLSILLSTKRMHPISFPPKQIILAKALLCLPRRVSVHRNNPVSLWFQYIEQKKNVRKTSDIEGLLRLAHEVPLQTPVLMQFRSQARATAFIFLGGNQSVLAFNSRLNESRNSTSAPSSSSAAPAMAQAAVRSPSLRQQLHHPPPRLPAQSRCYRAWAARP